MVDSHEPGRTGDGAPVRPAAAIVLAAGEGTRMRSAVPKVLHPIAGRSLLGHAVHAVAALEPEHLVVVVGHGRDQVGDAVTALGEELARPVLAAVQEKRLGTGHAVRCALEVVPATITGPVLVTYGDVPLLDPHTLADLMADAHEVRGGAHTADHRARRPHRVRPGAARVGRHGHPDRRGGRRHAGAAGGPRGELRGVRLRRRVPPRHHHRLRAANSQGELYLTDLVKIAHDDGRRCPRRALRRRLAGARRQRPGPARGHPRRAEPAAAARAGCARASPSSTRPPPGWTCEVRLEPDVVLHPDTQLHGRTSVAGGAEVGPDTTLTDCEIGAGARVVRTHGSRRRSSARARPSGRSPTCGRAHGSASAARSAPSSR